MTSGNPSLQQIYAQELQPVLEKLEAARVRLRSRILKTGLILVPLILVAGYFWGLVGLIGGAIAAVALGVWSNNKAMENYRTQFKQQVIQRLVKYHNPDLRYSPHEGISKETFRASRIYNQKIDRYHCEDLITGRSGETVFRFSEVHAEYKTHDNDDDKDDWHTIFQGIFFIADFNKHFQGVTLVLPDRLEKLGGVGRMLQSLDGILNNRPPQLVKLEDPIFEAMFAVHSTDQVEARYILSTSLMQRLVDFCQKTKAKQGSNAQGSIALPYSLKSLKYIQPDSSNNAQGSIALAFLNSCVYIAIPTNKNYFEPPSILQGSALLTLQDMQNYLTDIQMAQDIVEDLNLNTRIWGK